jgi:hypothetical protein
MVDHYQLNLSSEKKGKTLARIEEEGVQATNATANVKVMLTLWKTPPASEPACCRQPTECTGNPHGLDTPSAIQEI